MAVMRGVLLSQATCVRKIPSRAVFRCARGKLGMRFVVTGKYLGQRWTCLAFAMMATLRQETDALVCAEWSVDTVAQGALPRVRTSVLLHAVTEHRLQGLKGVTMGT